MPKRFELKDVIGYKNNRLEVIEFISRDKNKIWVKCKCTCGNYNITLFNSVRIGDSKSCGCLAKEVNSKNCKKLFSVYDYNLDFFKTLTPESSYFLGLLYTDGSLDEKNKCVKLTLHKDDSYMLEKLSNFITFNNKPIYFTKTKCNIFSITNTTIFKQLKDLGIYQNKTYTLTVPDYLLENVDFWRGCIDGDGHVIFKNNKLIFGLCGTIDLITNFKNFCSKYIDVGNIVIKKELNVNKGNFARFTLSGKKAKIIGNILYYNDLCLLRKKDSLIKYDEYQKGDKNYVKIYQYSLKGQLINEFKNYNECKKFFNCKHLSLSKIQKQKFYLSKKSIFSTEYMSKGFIIENPLQFTRFRKNNLNLDSIINIKKDYKLGESRKFLCNKYNLKPTMLANIIHNKCYNLNLIN